MADAPEILHTRTVTVPAAETNAFQVKPVPGSAAGLTATAMEVAAPLTACGSRGANSRGQRATSDAASGPARAATDW